MSLNTLIWVLVVGGAIVFGLHTYVFEVWTIPADDPLLSTSVMPMMKGGDLLVLSRSPGMQRGELVRCVDPEQSGRFVIGRATARGGETVEINGELVLVDRRRSPSPRACDAQTVLDPKRNEEVQLQCAVEEFAGKEFQVLRSGPFPEPPVSAAVEHLRWYLVSDNRHVHLDSRDFGTVDPTTCQHVLFRVVGTGGLADSDTRFTLLW
jgi:signal peptidase I